MLPWKRAFGALHTNTGRFLTQARTHRVRQWQQQKDVNVALEGGTPSAQASI